MYCFNLKVICTGNVPCPRDGKWCRWPSKFKYCTKPCGLLGMGLKLRKCACPTPAYGGLDCKIKEFKKITFFDAESGNRKNIYDEFKHNDYNFDDDDYNNYNIPNKFAYEEIKAGRGIWEPCNRIFCPYSKIISVKETKFIINDLKRQMPKDAWSWSGGIAAAIHSPVHLHCPASRESRKFLFDQPGRFPKAKAYWTKTIPRHIKTRSDYPGKPIETSEFYFVEGDHLTIRMLDENQTGFYRYGYEYEPGFYETVCFFSIYIKNKKIASYLKILFFLFCTI